MTATGKGATAAGKGVPTPAPPDPEPGLLDWGGVAVLCLCGALAALLEALLVPLYAGSVLVPIAVVLAVASAHAAGARSTPLRREGPLRGPLLSWSISRILS